MIILAGTIRIAAGKRTAAQGALERMVHATRAESGCVEYAFAFDVLDAHVIRIFEVFQDADALAAHRASAHMAAWRAEGAELGIHERNLRQYEVASMQVI
jgi:quinol monooxygenase YgiN